MFGFFESIRFFEIISDRFFHKLLLQISDILRKIVIDCFSVFEQNGIRKIGIFDVSVIGNPAITGPFCNNLYFKPCCLYSLSKNFTSMNRLFNII